MVASGQTIATLYTDDRLELTVPLTEGRAALIPGLFSGERASATVEGRFAGQPVRWEAEVVRVEPELDPQTRTLDVTLALTDPTEPQTEGRAADLASGVPPALINAYVMARIDGAIPQDVYAIPSTSLRAGDEIWLADRDDRLRIRSAETILVDGGTSFVRLDVDPDDLRLVTSPLDAPVEGVALNIVQDPARQTARVME